MIFAGVSLPLAVAAVVYFINHRYSGTPLWNLRDVPGVHAAVWGLSLVSFFFLYPSTFNLLEVCTGYKLLPSAAAAPMGMRHLMQGFAWLHHLHVCVSAQHLFTGHLLCIVMLCKQ